MDHEPLMRVLYCVAHLPKKLQPFSNREAMVGAVLVDGDPFDQVHHQIRNTVVSRATVQESGNVGMIKRRENLALGAEAFQKKTRRESAAHEFDSDFLLVLTVGASRAIHLAHAAVTNFF